MRRTMNIAVYLLLLVAAAAASAGEIPNRPEQLHMRDW